MIKLKVYALWKAERPPRESFSYVIYTNGNVYPANSSTADVSPRHDCPILLGLYKTFERAQKAMAEKLTNDVTWISIEEVIE